MDLDWVAKLRVILEDALWGSMISLEPGIGVAQGGSPEPFSR